MDVSKTAIIDEVAQYYSAKLRQHGETPAGVDWNGEEHQVLRFQQLCKIINASHDFSISDFGCGYGALFDFLRSRFTAFSYFGIDVSEEMIQAAKQRFKNFDAAEFLLSSIPSKSDYCVASGVFNVRQERSDEEWCTYILATLDSFYEQCEKGFAFNCLTAYSDKEKMKDYLFYSDPCWLFNICKCRYSRNVALLHDYNLYEFTILVRKEI